MPFVSTRATGAAPIALSDAIRQGLAPDGGLYVPVSLPVMSRDEWTSLRGRTIPEVASALLAPLVADTFSRADLDRLMASALSFPIPLVPLAPNVWVLELFHGPTLAFKDVGARTMARWLAHTAGHRDASAPLTVLVATSGDTGGAVADAFFGVAGTRVVVLYPRGRVSAVQEAQFSTLGGNVAAVAVDGTFDDCQRLVKEAFADRALATRHRLTSANSINIGRLLPQMAYYAWAVLQLPADLPPPIITVPSGNLGNITAGLMAARRGVPIARFVAATTANDPLPRFLDTGRYEPRPTIATLANAMDVGNPSNFERLRWLFGDDLAAMRAAIQGVVVSDDDVRRTIRTLADDYGYTADPHTAVGYAGAVMAGQADGGDQPRIVLGTAHPAKFREVVEPVLGREVALPPALAARLEHPPLSRRIEPSSPALADALAALA